MGLIVWSNKILVAFGDRQFQALLQSNLPYVTFQGYIEIGSHKTGGHLIQV